MKIRMAFDADTLMKDDGSPIADSATAHRILSSCVKNLDADDLVTVAECLKERGMLSENELSEIKTAVQGSPDDDATDPDAEMARDSAIRKRYSDLFRDGKITSADYSNAIANPGQYRPRSNRQIEGFNSRFPDAAKVQHR